MTTSFAKVLVGNELSNEVLKSTDELIKSDKEFTAHTVTSMVRKSVGPTVEVVHNDVRQIVHNIMGTTGNYEEFLKDYGSTKARAYRPNGKQKKNTQSVVANMPLNVTGTLTVTKAAPGGKFICNMVPKSEGRLTVPSIALKAIGVKPHSHVWLTKNKDLLTLSTVTGHTKYVADKHGSVRLRNKYLQGCKKFRVEINNTYGAGVVQLVGER